MFKILSRLSKFGRKPSVERNALNIALLITASRILGTIRESLISALVNLSQYDMYTLAVKLPSMIRRLSSEGTFENAYVPSLNQFGEDEQVDASNWISGISAIIFTFSSIIIYLFIITVNLWAPYFLRAYNSTSIGIFVQLFTIMLPIILCYFLSSTFIAILHKHEYFIHSNLGQPIGNIFMIITTYIGYMRSDSPVNLAITTLVGASVHLLWQYYGICMLNKANKRKVHLGFGLILLGILMNLAILNMRLIYGLHHLVYISIIPLTIIGQRLMGPGKNDTQYGNLNFGDNPQRNIKQVQDKIEKLKWSEEIKKIILTSIDLLYRLIPVVEIISIGMIILLQMLGYNFFSGIIIAAIVLINIMTMSNFKKDMPLFCLLNSSSRGIGSESQQYALIRRYLGGIPKRLLGSSFPSYWNIPFFESIFYYCILGLMGYFFPPFFVLGYLINKLIYIYRFHIIQKQKNPRITEINHKFLRIAGNAFFGTGIYQIMSSVSLIVSAKLGSGAPSYMSRADKIIQFPVGMLGVSFGMALLPRISALICAKKYKEADRLYLSMLRYNVILCALVIVFSLFMAEPIANFLFRHGKTTTNDVRIICNLFKIQLIGLPASVVTKTLYPIYFGGSRSELITRSAIFQCSTDIILKLILLTMNVGIYWILLSGIIGNWISAIYLFSMRKNAIYHPIKKDNELNNIETADTEV